MNIDHLSPSQIELYWTCPRAYKYSYVDGIKTKPNFNIARGSISHYLIERILLNPKTDLYKAIDDYAKHPESQLNQLSEADAAKTIESTKRIIPIIQSREWAPTEKVEIAEQSLETNIEGIRIIVKPDIVSETTVYDHKIIGLTSVFKYEKMKYPTQLVIGALATGKNTGAYNLFIEDKNGDFIYRRIQYHYLSTRAKRVIEKIKTTYKLISEDVFPPVDKDGNTGWKCSRKFCDYYDICEFGAKDEIDPESAEAPPF